MPALAATNVTVTMGTRDRDFARAGTLKNLSIASIAFGDGVLTYPADGVPLPALGVFGIHREMDLLPIESSANGFVYKYDRTNHKLKIFTQGVTTGSTQVSPHEPTEPTVAIENSAGADQAALLFGAAADTAYDFGPLKELPATIAPAAVTIRALVIGE